MTKSRFGVSGATIYRAFGAGYAGPRKSRRGHASESRPFRIALWPMRVAAGDFGWSTRAVTSTFVDIATTAGKEDVEPATDCMSCEFHGLVLRDLDVCEEMRSAICSEGLLEGRHVLVDL